MTRRKGQGSHRYRIAGTVLAAYAGSAAAADNDTALTIYSTAQPGGIPAEYY